MQKKLMVTMGRPAGGVYPFRAWRMRLGLTQAEAAKLIDRTETQVRSYEKMAELPQNIRLAMLALEYLPSWRLGEIGLHPYWRKPSR